MMAEWIMDYYVQGASLLYITMILTPFIYHLIHFVYRFVFDIKYDVLEHGFFTRWGDTEYDGQDIGFSVYIFGLIALVFLGFALLFYKASIVVLIVVTLMYMARGVVRLKKALDKHIRDKDAHK